MSFDREDFYNECKHYCQNVDLLELIDDMIIDSKYESFDENSLLHLKSYLLNNIEFTEKKRVGHTLNW